MVLDWLEYCFYYLFLMSPRASLRFYHLQTSTFKRKKSSHRIYTMLIYRSNSVKYLIWFWTYGILLLLFICYVTQSISSFLPSVYACTYTYLSARAGCDTKSIFRQSLTGLNSEFFFSSTGCHTKVEDLRLPNYLPIAEGRRIGFIPFAGVLVHK